MTTDEIKQDSARAASSRCPECNLDLTNFSAEGVRHHAMLCLPHGEELKTHPTSDHGRRYRLLVQLAAKLSDKGVSA